MVHGQSEQVGIGDPGSIQQAIRTQHAWGQQAEACQATAKMAQKRWRGKLRQPSSSGATTAGGPGLLG